MPQCFPELDTRVLTDAGFLFLDEIEARLARGEQVLYACYQRSRPLRASDDDGLQGELVYRTGKLVYSPPPRELIVFNSRQAAQGSDFIDVDGEDTVGEGQCSISRHVSLRVTPQHRMYVQLDHVAPPEKVHASTLLSECDCPPAQPCEVDCFHRRASVRLLCCATDGRQPSPAERHRVRARVQRRLGLTDAQVPAFLELLGFWLGNGSSSSLSYAPCAVQLQQRSSGDVAFVDGALAAVGLRCKASFQRDEHAVGTSWHITDRRWFDFFDRQFGCTHPASRYYKAPADVDKESEPPSVDRLGRSAQRLPDWVLRCLTPGEMRRVRDGLWRAGGRWKRRQRLMVTSSVAFRDQLVQLLLLCGCSPSAEMQHPAGASKATQAAWAVSWAEPMSSSGKAACQPSLLRHEAITRQPYSAARDGRVWCVTVDHPEHLIVAQRATRHHGVVLHQSLPLIVGQSEEARIEALSLMGVEHNLVTPRHGEPLVTATQDFITTAYLITQRDVFYDRAEFTQIACYFADATEAIDMPPPAVLKPTRLWTGKQLMSLLIRPNGDACWPNVNLECKERNYTRDLYLCQHDGYVVIRHSQLMCGNWAKSTVGGDKAGLLYSLIRDHSSHQAAVLLNRLAKLSARWIGNRGFSIGIEDVTPSAQLQRHKAERLARGYADCDQQIDLFRRGELIAASGCDEEQTLESTLLGALSSIREELGSQCLKELDYQHNSPLIMAVAGSKGSKINISQMISAVGQQAVNGHRIPNGFVNRSLPHFPKHSRSPASKGFVENSFYSGLNATEFFFHTMGGREGLVDTAVKTAETGYMQRRLMKALEDLCVQYDHTVRTSEHNVVQFTYGDDGLDPLMMTQGHQPVQFHRVLEQVKATVLAPAERCLLPAEVVREVEQLPAAQWQDCSAQFISRMKDFVVKTADDLQRAMDSVGIGGGEGGEEREAAWHSIHQTRKLTRSQLTAFFAICHAKYRRARIEPGTAVGAIGAQSIGEPGTQMTLKSVDWADRVVVMVAGAWQVLRIGEWIDGLMGCGKAPAEPLPPEQVVLLEAPEPDEVDGLLLPLTGAKALCPCGQQSAEHDVTDACTQALLAKLQQFNCWMAKDGLETVSSGALHRNEAYSHKRRKTALRRSDPSASRESLTDCKRRSESAIRHRIAVCFQSPFPEPCNGVVSASLSSALMTPLSASMAPNVKSRVERRSSMQTDLNVGAAVMLLFGSHEHRLWAETSLLQSREEPLELEEGIRFYSASTALDDRHVTVLEASHPSCASARQLQAALLAATRAATDRSLLYRWASQVASRRLRALAQQQAAASTYTNPAVERVDEADAEMGDTRLLRLSDAQVFVPSVSPSGAISLRRVTAVTKHLPLNADGTRTLLRVRTRTGRMVTATKAKSFLTRRDGQLSATRGDELQVGAYLPINSRLPALAHPMEAVDVSPFFPSAEDAVRQLSLDELTGFFCGVFAAAGRTSDSQVVIATAEPDIAKLVLSWLAGLKAWGEVDAHLDRDGRGCITSVSVASPQLSALLRHLGGHPTGERRVPQFVLTASDACARAFIDGYFSACGLVCEDGLLCSSTSEELILGLQLLLTRFGVFTHLTAPADPQQAPVFQLSARNGDVKQFARLVPLTLRWKRAAVAKLAEAFTSTTLHGDHDVIPGCTLPIVQANLSATESHEPFRAAIEAGVIPRLALQRLLSSGAHRQLPDAEVQQLRAAVESPVVYDQVVSIEEVQPSAQFVYDLTVEGDRTFQMADGLLMFDTFHFAGVASMNITLGVPRIKEVINAAKKISTPIITAPLVSPTDVKAARIVKGRIEKTTLGEVASYIEEVFSPQHCHLTVRLDLDAIAALQLHITADSVVQAILRTKRLKLKTGVVAKSDAVIRVVPQADDDDASLMFAFTRLKAALPSVVVQGVANVNRAVINDTGGGHYNLLVEGYNLLGVMTTLGVKGEQCTSNHVDEMCSSLGIEAARQTIIREIATTMEGHGMTIDYRHMALLADIMCYRGKVLGITRFGVAQMKESVLMLASFEKTADHLFEAALRGVEDGIAGVSECIIMGTPMRVGTGLFQLLHKVEGGEMRMKRKQWQRAQLLMHDTDTK